jgi:hypothetical protein
MMKNELRRLALLLFPFVCAAVAYGADDPWGGVGAVFGQPGRAFGSVQKYGWPRTDLEVSVRGTKVSAPLALGSWAAFVPASSGAMAMGDLVLRAAEVNPVIRELQRGGFEILAVHNHLLGETPQVLYVHYMGSGDPVALARTLKAALAKTSTPAPKPASKASRPDAEDVAAFAKLQSALGRTGMVVGRVLQVGVPRADAITDHGMEIPPSAGMATSLNFQRVGKNVAATGDFVLTADEVNPVIERLEAGGVEVTALHSHMLRETPRLFFMHFWVVDSPAKVGGALKAALEKVKVKQER